MGAHQFCECGCAKSRHRYGKKACEKCGVCDQFELAPGAWSPRPSDTEKLEETTVVVDAPADVPVIEPEALAVEADGPLVEHDDDGTGWGAVAAAEVLAEVVPAELEAAIDEALDRPSVAEIVAAAPPPDTLSTSARLAKAEQERNELADLLDGAEKQVAHIDRERDLARDEGVRLNVALLRAERERDEAQEEIRILKNSEGLDVVRARAELSSARQELQKEQALRQVNLNDLEGAYGELRALRAELADVQAAAEEKVRGVIAADAPAIDALKAELAEALTEVDNLRASRASAESQLIEAQDVIRVMEQSESLEVVAAHAGLDAASVLDAVTRWLCQPVTGCGAIVDQPQPDNRCPACLKRLIAVTTTTAITVN